MLPASPRRPLLEVSARNELLILIFVLVLMTVPWLGTTFFNSKGEPREAIVAVSMLQSDNWVLPTTYGGDIPYKPPFLAWIIAVFSLIFNGGTVNEFCSRLPSALAMTAMVTGFYIWLRNREGRGVAFTAAIVLATSFEVFRSSVICRVDMLLTACIVLSLLLMHSWRQSRKWWKIPSIILLLSGAVLTKGPVGALLPCLAMGIYCLIKKDNFFFTVGWLTGLCAASMLLPAVWYVAAYEQGGDSFLALVREENLGRLTGSMGYDSHVNPWYYNLLTILWGMLPWTIVTIVAMFVRKWQKPRLGDVALFSLTAALTVLVFYCIPSSKRSVYLLPMYPFMAYGVARLMAETAESRTVKVYARVWVWIVLVASALVVVVPYLSLGKLQILAPQWWQWPAAAVAPGVCIFLLHRRVGALKSLPASTAALFFCYLSVAQPLALNPKSDRGHVAEVQQLLDADVPVYTLIEDSLMRYYTINFYVSDRLRRIESVDTSVLQPPYAVLVQEQCLDRLPDYVNDSYEAAELTPRSCDNRRGIIICKVKGK